MVELRLFQKTALEVLQTSGGSLGTHLLCVAPTGAGKSLIYEKAAEMKGCKTLLISPLSALARQQFKSLTERGVNATMGGLARQGPPEGESGVWIVSPESLLYPSREKLLQKWKANFMVVDECHCFWEWGERFRPAFQILPELVYRYSIRKSLWLTATLPFEARVQLRGRLPSGLIEMGEFEFPAGVQLRVQRIAREERPGFVFEWLKKQKGTGIVFVPTREATHRIARMLQSMGRGATAYHAGLDNEVRRSIENTLSNGNEDILVATSAFGMGMNYRHFSFVIFWQAPVSLLSLVQGLGRVGRNPATKNEALVLWEPEDFRFIEWTAVRSEFHTKELKQVYEFMSTSLCRTVFLKRYFDRGTGQETPCMFCDNCLTSSSRLLLTH
jgi:ATP-dependent DNA helicase RecQ